MKYCLFGVIYFSCRQAGYVFCIVSSAIRFSLISVQKTDHFLNRRSASLLLLYSLILNGTVLSQSEIYRTEHRTIDSLKQQLALADDDSERIMIMDGLGFNYERLNNDSSLKYSYAALALARKNNFAWGEARLLASLTGVLGQQGKFADALEVGFQSLKIAESNHLPHETARANRRLSGIYDEMGNYPKSIEYSLRALKIDELHKYERSAAIDHMSLAGGYYRNNNLDSAIRHLEISFQRKGLLQNQMSGVYEIAGDIEKDKANYHQALVYYWLGYSISQQISEFRGLSQFSAAISSIYVKLGKTDSARFYALKGIEYAQQVSFRKGIVLSGTLLSELYDSIQPALALKYFKLAAGAKDSLFGATHIMTIQNQISREQARQNELQTAQLSYRNRLKVYSLIAGLAILFIVVFFLYRNNKQKQIANIILGDQKNQIELTLKELKSTQSQLIQAEKMASLGQLTAGIAHEIQNPLNFVNNFSEVSEEMIDDAIGTRQEAGENSPVVAELLTDIKQNLHKINHHGKRADAIVKGMLQHSRSTTGNRELTEVNTLVDEYVKLSFNARLYGAAGQAFGGKDNAFDVKLQTNFDPEAGAMELSPQEIGRVLLNILNNAFYTVNDRKKKDPGFSPEVMVQTKKVTNGIEISVKDNGDGIPESIKDKIFQPFFTTKPTGQGTGLGLSLAYDIVKAHGGEITVESEKGIGSEFTIILNGNS